MMNNVAIVNYPIPKICPYCGSPVEFTTNDKIYGKTYGNGNVYMCTNRECDSYVGVHNGTRIPLGRLANKELRDLKRKAHDLFDPIWQSRNITRTDLYIALAIRLGIKVRDCHFGHFDKPMLLRAIKEIEEMR